MEETVMLREKSGHSDDTSGRPNKSTNEGTSGK